MFILATVAASVLASFLASMLVEGSKYHITDLWNSDKNLSELRSTLDKQLCELRIKLRNSDFSLTHSGLPSDWLDELEHYRHEIEDIEHSMDSARKKEIVTKFLQTNIQYVTRMQNNLAKKEGDMEAARLLNRPLTNLQDHPEFLDGELFIREEDRRKVIEELTTRDSFGVSIIGIGGIGKTVLAEAIRLEERIKTHFPCILLSPSQSPNFNSKDALDFIKGVQLPSKDQRVLILLDGVHSVTPEDWHQFSSHCKNNLNPESKILITTQNPTVANVTGTSEYCLDPLLGNECFSLIHYFADKYTNLSEADDHAIRHNEKELVESCKGLPSLAKQIGLILSATAPGHRRDTIIQITTRSSWKVPELERVLAKLKPVVSLFEQEPHLKRCLAYCSLFPQDYEFKRDNMVQFWMAEGFTQLSKDASYLEQTTRRYFDELSSCSLFQTSTTFPPGEKSSYKMHGLAYDMAQNIASKAFCRKHVGNNKSTSTHEEVSSFTRHFSLSCDDVGDDEEINIIDQLISDIQGLCSGLRTFLLFHDAGKNIHKNPTFFQNLTRLRVLDLSHSNLTKLEPKNISELKYLRYLDLSHTPVENLPKLSKSPELQVLKLNHCDKLRDLPKDLTKLTSLISLQVNTRGLVSMPLDIGKLTNLQRLDVFIVGKRIGFKISELRSLNGLRNSLRVTKLENVETKQEAQEAKLHKKVELERLELEWSSSAPNEAAKQVLEGLEPPKNLKELKIRNYTSPVFPEWLSRSEVCRLLECIHLDRCKVIPSLNQLPMLKKLHVESMHEITHELLGRNGTTTQAFPCIETLVLCDMPELNRWIDLAASCMPRLCNVQVDRCKSLLKLPKLDCLNSLKVLQINRCMVLEELPTLPTSLKCLIIKHSDILKERCQVGQADWPKIRGINKIEIDSEPVDMSEPGHQSSSVQPNLDQGTTNGDQQTSPPAIPNQIASKRDNSKGSHRSSSRGFGFFGLKSCFSKVE